MTSMINYFLIALVIQAYLWSIVVSEKGILSISSSPKFRKFAQFCLDSQQSIIKSLEEEDNRDIDNIPSCNFQQDPWERLDNATGQVAGKGITAVIQGGRLLEKGAVSTTIVRGVLSKERANAMSFRGRGESADLVGSTYYASALSIVLHSRSPMVPTFRADVRYFELENGMGWFGGGADLTPYYLFDEDATDFHSCYRDVCNTYSPDLFTTYKKWCDDYFFIPARGEHRGIGGIFFDDLCEIEDSSKRGGQDNAMAFTQQVCDSFMPSYLPIARRRCKLDYTEDQRHWQLLRRGRYIEFNMLYDRGVKFGLVPGGRVEAVFVSCPPLVAWDYNHVTREGSEEEKLMEILKAPRDW